MDRHKPEERYKNRGGFTLEPAKMRSFRTSKVEHWKGRLWEDCCRDEDDDDALDDEVGEVREEGMVSLKASTSARAFECAESNPILINKNKVGMKMSWVCNEE